MKLSELQRQLSQIDDITAVLGLGDVDVMVLGVDERLSDGRCDILGVNVYIDQNDTVTADIVKE